jgi:putative flavoprotein involved in K+ transport
MTLELVTGNWKLTGSTRSMRWTDAVIVGGGQAGLAISRCLADHGVEHVVLERGRIGERWLSERWSSLRLLTPNWQTRLPGFQYDGTDPDGYMTAAEVAALLDRYARSFAAPVETGTTVDHLERASHGFEVRTNRGTWQSGAVVIATGYCDRPATPPWAGSLSDEWYQLTPDRYRRAADLPPGGVLVVGASATGIQLAHEIREAGRAVCIAAGHHTRVPRRYRGLDVLWWLDRMGVLDERVEDVHNIGQSIAQPSFQLVGRPDGWTIDLSVLQSAGVVVAGRLIGIADGVAHFDDSLVATTVAADVKLAGLLRRIDRFIEVTGIDAPGARLDGFAPLWSRFIDTTPQIDLRASGIRTVLWATGYRRAYPWLKVPGVLDRRGELKHEGGVTPVAGLYVLGLQFQRRRNSSFIDGVGRDAAALAVHLAHHVRRPAA